MRPLPYLCLVAGFSAFHGLATLSAAEAKPQEIKPAPQASPVKPTEPKPVAPAPQAPKPVAKQESPKAAPKPEQAPKPAAAPLPPKQQHAAAPAKAEKTPVKAEAPKPAVAQAPKAPPISTKLPADRFVSEFMGRYCLECHDSGVQKGDRDFEEFALPLKNIADLISAKDVIDQITLKDMPPDKSEQPTDAERLALLQALRDGTTAARSQLESSGSRTVLRRLSNREYENTIATLFNRRVDTLGLTSDFPKEKTSRHIDTIGQSLVTSGFLVDQYFQAANRLVETRLNKPETPPQEWLFNKNFKQYEELQGPHKQAFNFRYLNLYEQPNTDTRQGGYGHIEDFLKGVPVSGLYDLEVEAQAMHRDTHYDPEIFGIDFSEPFTMAVVPGDVTKGHIHYPQAIEPILGSTTVPDDKPTKLKFRVWLEAGQTPRFIFPNGPYESRSSVIRINNKYKDEFKAEIPGSLVGRAHILLEGKLPHIRISEVKVNGPIVEPGGSAEEVAVFGKGGFQENKALEQLYAFAERAYRRPLKLEDQAPIQAVYEKRIKADKVTPRQAALDALKLILCSPSFLYFSEITDESQKHLQAYDLATRLSYTLWTAPPDEALRAKAKSGELMKPEVLRAEVKRMLTDARVNTFAHDFLESWLNLRDLGSQPPPRENYRSYYAEDLPSSMKNEIKVFFLDLLKNNGSARNFLDADYSFVDKKLAKLYNLPEKDTLRLADGFKKVSLKGNKQRGGLLATAGVLTVSANGVETSPVTRGVWVSENILGIHPPPPPDEVPAIEPDVSGATTVRQRLAQHSKDPTCGDCHRKIDPLGFSLENYDPIGRFRKNYAGRRNSSKPGPPVDASGVFTSGEAYQDFEGFRRILTQSREDYFIRNLITKLLSYSTGRHMEAADSYVIDEIHQKAKENQLGLQSILIECFTSEIFRSR